MLRKIHTLFSGRGGPSDETSEPGQSRGQVLVIFAFLLTILIGFSAFVVDIAWIWSHQLQVQRAADAAALAGVVHLPGDEPGAIGSALDESRRNGYQNGVNGVVVVPREDPDNDRRMVVDVSSPVDTFFMGIFGINQVTVHRTARAEYVLPVPMGSPENYYGVFGEVRTPSGGTTVVTPGDTGWRLATTSPSGNWTNAARAYSPASSPQFASDNQYATRNSTTDPHQAYSGFGITIPSGAVFEGIEVEVEAKSTDNTGCRLGVELTWRGANVGAAAANWTSTGDFMPLTNSDGTLVLGSSSDGWGEGSWSASELNNANFRVRVTNQDPGSNCTNGSTTSLDRVRVRVHYSTTTFTPDANLAGPSGEILAPRGFWGNMLAQGSEDVNGDAYMPMYEDRTSRANPDYLPGQYYDYAVEMPAGSSGGQVWIYDPVFCATNTNGQYGTGDRWFSGGLAISAFYDLYDTQGSLHDLSDDTLVASSGDLFRRIRASDPTLNGPGTGGGIDDCRVGATTDQSDGRYWHNRWWKFGGAALQGGRTYRVRTSSTDPNSASDQANADAQNSFAIWTTAAGEAPDVYGLGAMQAYTPLEAAQGATFYLAQIEAIHAGKTVIIDLWDPGDTQDLSATLRIMIPTSGGYTAANINWTAEEGTTHPTANCAATSGSGSSIVTNTGGSSRFQGCWVSIEIAIPASYTAPQPPGETEPGWWKINYGMGGSSGDDPAFDVTTWQVEIRGNPVHLITPEDDTPTP